MRLPARRVRFQSREISLSSIRAASLAALSVIIASAVAPDASAHCFVGARFLPATLTTDDPCVADELSLPTVTAFGTGDDPSNSQVNYSLEYSKRITSTLGISIGSTLSQITLPGAPTINGFQNLETTVKWQFLTLPQQEFVMSVGLGIEWGGTGLQDVGAETFSTYTPTIWFAKGFGDLPDSVGWLRPFAITGQVGYAFPGVAARTTVDPDSGDVNVEYHAQVLRWGGTLQYSMPYLKSSVVDLGLPEVFNQLNPIVEVAMQTPMAYTLTSGTLTTGTISPGLIWTGRHFQLGVEALIPINRQSGSNIGVIAQVHFYLDDIFPRTIGKPLFGESASRRAMGY
jgi:hypothetical protein